MIEFYKKLKNLRKSKNITQEQLAGYLGVSPQAVSRWECGTACPDISMLPQLADFFEITVDELLGVDEQEKRREIDAIVAETSELIDQNITEEPIRILREGLNRYPNNDRLLCTLMYGMLQARIMISVKSMMLRLFPLPIGYSLILKIINAVMRHAAYCSVIIAIPIENQKQKSSQKTCQTSKLVLNETSIGCLKERNVLPISMNGLLMTCVI